MNKENFKSPFIKFEISSATLNSELLQAKDFNQFLYNHKDNMLNQSLKEHLDNLLVQKKITIADVVRASNLDRTYVYQIFAGKKNPSRDKLIAIAFGLQLTVDETQKLLKVSGNRELYVRDERDALIFFSLHHKKDIFLNCNNKLNYQC